MDSRLHNNDNDDNHVDHVLHDFLALSDLPSLSLSLSLSLDRLLQSSASLSDGDHLVDRAFTMGSILLEVAKHSYRNRASVHNSLTWPLPPDLTMKVFSLVDTSSLCHAAATCKLFRNWAKDPFCYSHIDLRTPVPKVNDALVATIIHRAGKALRSLMLGVVPDATTSSGSCQPLSDTRRKCYSCGHKRSQKDSCHLTRCCLNPLNADGGALGALLRKLHLYNIGPMDSPSLVETLSVCPSLLDLEIVGLDVELGCILSSVSANCHLIERFAFAASTTGRNEILNIQTCSHLVAGCPHLTSLSLRGIRIHDYKVRILVKGFQKLKYLDFSRSVSITGSFLRNLGNSNGGNFLEFLNLRDCMHLKEMEVARLLTAIIAGNFKSLVHLDISNREGLGLRTDRQHTCYSSSIMPVKEVLDTRPWMRLMVDYPSDRSNRDP
ncbi:hypothetical protein HN51_015430 [Arachis hypogaea]|uniref:F-box domain-containing protein n=1 Tax=Arachis hypogaea TaxID=3818 RepID=A0A445CKM9_ARAHY|nr:F-box protein SKIP17 isoform X1 [Arachis hypogaea]QHO45879.1 F-box protein [Arachis hypogaea]QHO45880.1 F-box protein [Arachis hypogaea]QHO45881.1 F-box protein [Arachis hypogaea]RYR51468.1 hypothetical protein Ahy_A06g026484 [Arachis hypogaea]